MIQIEETLISEDIIRKKFVCDLKHCKGKCCIEGSSGAPLIEEELPVMVEIYPAVKPYLRQISRDTIESQGNYIVDFEGDYVTPLIDGKECAYVYFEDGIAKCAIEKAYQEKKIRFRKPLSCHLFPVRISKTTYYDALNYEKQPFCKAARELGEKQNIPVYQFLKDVLIRKYGEYWYEQLCHIAESLKTMQGGRKINGK